MQCQVTNTVFRNIKAEKVRNGDSGNRKKLRKLSINNTYYQTIKYQNNVNTSFSRV